MCKTKNSDQQAVQAYTYPNAGMCSLPKDCSACEVPHTHTHSLAG